MSAISVGNLIKTFRVRRPEEGLRGALKTFVKPRYDEVRAVDDLSFELAPGERVAFVGPNGAGKSTTIKILSGILHPTAGNVSVLGYIPWKDRAKMAFRIGTVFGQRSQLWYHLPAEDTFGLLAKAYELDDSVYKQRKTWLSDVFGLGPLLGKPVRQLSLGERMRCEIAASLLHKPQVLFLDEPTVGLDVTAKGIIRDLVRDASEKDGTTVLLTSHDTGDMERVCDRVLVIDHGRLVIDNTMRALRSDYIRRKVVTLAMKEKDIRLEGDGCDILEQAPHYLKLAVDTTKTEMDDIIRCAMNQSALQDITIEDPPMEEIVRSIYAGNRGGNREVGT